uniref:Endonuclease/exonuclease/phosphatase domain-containing protein n=1 Tax=Graphocephala atropunctata TaxID=36148 RepID=A0A1B6LT39_9HEMI
MFLSNYRGWSVIIGGDLNADFDVTISSKTSRGFQNILRQNNFFYMNKRPTRGNHCLDNIFLNFPDQVNSCDIFNFPFSDHNGLLLNLRQNCTLKEVNSYRRQKSSSFIIQFPKLAIPDLIDGLWAFDWDPLLSIENTLNAYTFFQKFFGIVIRHIDYHSTIKCRRPNTKTIKSQNKWYTQELSQMRDRLLFLHKLIKEANCENLHRTYSDLKRRYKTSIREAKLSYNVKKIESSSNKCKAAWNLIKENNVNSSSHQSDIDISPDNFNTFFISSVEEIKTSIIKPNTNCITLLQNLQIERNSFRFVKVTPSDVAKAIKNLKSSDSKDVFNLTNNIFKSRGYFNTSYSLDQ